MSSTELIMVAKPIVVIGSICMDLVCRTPRIPAAGELSLGSAFATIPGGKGANQAVGAARLGGTVHLIARVGDDDFGDRMHTNLAGHRVNVEHVTVSEGESTGVAVILIDAHGENCTVVASGANQKLRPEDIDAADALIATAAVVVLQGDVPLETIRHAVAMCQRLAVYTILDPAPVPVEGLPRAVLGVDLLTPNQGEAERLIGIDATHHVSAKKIVDPKQVCMELLSRGAKTVVMKLGGKGAIALDRSGEMLRIAPHKVALTDTTAADDAFTAALAVGHSEGMSLRAAARFANAAGALCCTSFGAQPSLPSRDAVEMLLHKS